MLDKNKELRPLIIDFGNSTFRLGFAGEDAPEIITPAVYVNINDYLFESDVIEGLEDLFFKEKTDSYLYGDEALKYQNILKIHEFKKENNYVILSRYFHYYYQKLNISHENQYKQPIIIIAPFFMTEIEKTKLEQVFFELNFPYILFLSESQAILQTLQKTTGVVINIGESYTYISTIFHGFTNIMARDVYPVAGKELTNHFLNLIVTKKTPEKSEKKIKLDKWLAKEIKEKSSLCVLNAEAERQNIKQGLTNYNQLINFPDGSNLEIDEERFLLSEPLFDPKFIHIDHTILPEMIAKTIKIWDRENWEEIIPNIILSGGGSLIPGIKERLKQSLEPYFSEKIKSKLKVIAVSGREHMSWIGASILHLKNQIPDKWKSNPDWSPPEIDNKNEEVENNVN